MYTNMFLVKTLEEFNYFPENMDRGQPIRQAAKRITELLVEGMKEINEGTKKTKGISSGNQVLLRLSKARVEPQKPRISEPAQIPVQFQQNDDYREPRKRPETKSKKPNPQQKPGFKASTVVDSNFGADFLDLELDEDNEQVQEMLRIERLNSQKREKETKKAPQKLNNNFEGFDSFNYSNETRSAPKGGMNWSKSVFMQMILTSIKWRTTSARRQASRKNLKIDRI